MSEQMEFPETFERFAEEYGFKDKKEVYTNCSDLIQVYRVKQWIEHDKNKTLNKIRAEIEDKRINKESEVKEVVVSNERTMSACKDVFESVNKLRLQMKEAEKELENIIRKGMQPSVCFPEGAANKKEIEEAIKELRRDIELDNDFTDDYINAVETVTKALEQEICEDTISREALHIALYENFHDEDAPNNITRVDLGAVRNFVKDFPPAIPARKKGK